MTFQISKIKFLMQKTPIEKTLYHNIRTIWNIQRNFTPIFFNTLIIRGRIILEQKLPG